MAFPDAAFEDQRAAFAQSMGVKLDKRTGADVATVAVVCTIYFINMLAVITMVWNRNYPPLKAKCVPLLASMFVAMGLCFVGDFEANGHVQLSGSGLSNCRGIGIWVHLVLGFCAISGMCALRSLMLYQVFCRNLPCRGLKFYLPIAAYLTLIFTYGIVTMAVNEKDAVYYFPELDLCAADTPYKTATVVLVWVTQGAVLVSYWFIRNIRSSFNESREMAFVTAASLTGLISTTIIQYVVPTYPLLLPYRMTMSYVTQLAINTTWWGMFAIPLFNCLFRRQKYLTEWTAKLRQDGMQREYRVDSSVGMQPIPDNAAPKTRPSFAHKESDNNNFYYSNESGTRLCAPSDSYSETGHISGHESAEDTQITCPAASSTNNARQLV
ncbi:hypothetical protein GGI04_003983 [Coemansia thaxteri]|nr:hypothetical protein GGI04_003983 [Coemansia thaxteri]KAJ2471778.1 hypothetical protein GGI02_002050 [Coemansia sp. RSA 2322]